MSKPFETPTQKFKSPVAPQFEPSEIFAVSCLQAILWVLVVTLENLRILSSL